MARVRAWPSLWWPMAAGVVVKDRYGEFCILKGSSMLPTIQADGDVGLLDRLCLAGHDFTRGDVVVFRSPTDHRRKAVQRLIVLPGDWIQIPEKREIRQVPDGHCWVEGTMPAKAWTRDTMALIITMAYQSDTMLNKLATEYYDTH
ncbi:unnamed protein product [Miscanthus lutarioriparius]|uniref:Peptidase S26 domain-containing protein n=1 Tax=Miscanthus lutarioriparius TaxID=422564 RepID=A0A811R312_9POAL|nr:unnamed protein product [Miscanthus lutarioriparius]